MENKESKEFIHCILERDKDFFKALTDNKVEFKTLDNNFKLPDKVIGYLVKK